MQGQSTHLKKNLQKKSSTARNSKRTDELQFPTEDKTEFPWKDQSCKLTTTRWPNTSSRKTTTSPKISSSTHNYRTGVSTSLIPYPERWCSLAKPRTTTMTSTSQRPLLTHMIVIINYEYIGSSHDNHRINS